MSAPLDDLAGIVADAAACAESFPFSVGLGWSETMHNQKRLGLHLLLLELHQRASALLLGQGVGTEINIPPNKIQIGECRELLRLAQSDGSDIRERWMALERLCAESQAMLS